MQNLYQRLTSFLFVLLLSSLAVVNTAAQTWTDITEYYIDNPNFNSGNTNGWEMSMYNYNSLGYQGATYRNGSSTISGFIETWRNGNILGSGTLNTTVNMPAGKYRLSADCVSSNQIWGNTTVQGVYLYAETSNGTQYTTSLSTRSGAPQYYTVEFTVSTAGDVKLGLLLTEGHNANWVAADNFKLEKSGSLVKLNYITLSKTTLSVELGGTSKLTTTFSPSNATIQKCIWHSSDPTIVSVDASGNLLGKNKGTAEVWAESVDGSVVSNKCKVTVTYTKPAEGALIINEIQASNIDMFLDPSFNYGSWIEIYNSTNTNANLGSLYITDDPANLRKHRLAADFGFVPAKGYKNIWFDHSGIWSAGEIKQVGFKLNYDGGTIIISDGNEILVQETYPQAIGRTSYARTTDGGSAWGVSAFPTPEATNASMTFASTQLASPVVSVDGKVFSSSFTTQVTIPTGTTLRYTTDGTTPTLTNGSVSTTGRFTVSNSTVYRFRLFRTGYLPSEVVTRSYLKDDGKFPIVSVVTDNANLNSTEFGIFQKGPNGRAGNGQDATCNWNMDWDRPVNFEYITENNEYVLSQEVDMSTCGGWSRAYTPHSFKLKAAKYYAGKNSMDYQFFEGKPFLKHKTLQIRNGGNDTGARLKDASLQEIIRRSGLYVDGQSWKPVKVYFNGSYYAILNMREPNNKHFAYANYGIDSDFIDQFEISPDSGYVQMAGTKDSFLQLYNLAEDAANPVAYQQICSLLDIDEFINYMAVQLYLGGTDFPQNNVKGFRDQNDGKFHFVLFDLDFAFNTNEPFSNLFGRQYYTFNALRGVDGFGNSLWGIQETEEIEFVTIFRNLLSNSDFRKQFVDAYCIIAGSVFDPERCNEIVDEMASRMSDGGVSSWGTANEVKNGLAKRQNAMTDGQLRSRSELGVRNITPQQVTLSSNVDGAELLINGIPVPTGKFSGNLYSPVTFTANAPAGYKFAGWAGHAESGNAETVFAKGSTWKYYDEYYADGDGGLDGQNWKTATFAQSWASGYAPIGYDKADNPKGLNTWFTYYPRRTYYASKTFNLTSAVSNSDVFTLDYDVDDAMVVYVNGEEAGRYNLPTGEAITSNTNGGWAMNNPDHGTMTLPAGLFKLGENTIAVEIHNFYNPTTSSDLYWDAALTWQSSSAPSSYLSTSTQYTMPSSGSVALTAVFQPLSDKEIQLAGLTPVKVNEVSAANTVYVNDQFKKDDWIELYNTTDASVDVAGMYLSDDESQPQKFQIPDNDVQQTVIAPHSHLVVWASKRDNNGKDIHANFKLSNTEGEKVILTSETGDWSDELTYSAHGGQESVGLYPDGSNEVYFMSHPTIGKPNTVTSYAKYLYTNDKPMSGDDTFTLNLTEGWNWVSHPMERSLSVSEINRNATRIMSQTAENTRDTKGWAGTISALAPTSLYKVKMISDDTFTFVGPLFAEGNTIALSRGWNWIGYPVASSQTLQSALSRFVPAEGDVIVGQNGFATYESNRWLGTLEVLQPGVGYMYRSASPKSLTYAPVSHSSASARAPFRAQPRSPWTANASAHPNVMSVVAQVRHGNADHSSDLDDDEAQTYSVGAFSADGECRGVGKYIEGTLFITIHGEGGEDITFRAADANTGIVYDVAETLTFTSDLLGTRLAPLFLTLSSATDIASLRNSPAVMHAECYTLDGVRVANSTNSLTKGVYVVKYSLRDGTVIVKKVVK